MGTDGQRFHDRYFIVRQIIRLDKQTFRIGDAFSHSAIDMNAEYLNFLTTVSLSCEAGAALRAA